MELGFSKRLFVAGRSRDRMGVFGVYQGWNGLGHYGRYFTSFQKDSRRWSGTQKLPWEFWMTDTGFVNRRPNEGVTVCTVEYIDMQ